MLRRGDAVTRVPITVTVERKPSPHEVVARWRKVAMILAAFARADFSPTAWRAIDSSRQDVVLRHLAGVARVNQPSATTLAILRGLLADGGAGGAQ